MVRISNEKSTKSTDGAAASSGVADDCDDVAGVSDDNDDGAVAAPALIETVVAADRQPSRRKHKASCASASRGDASAPARRAPQRTTASSDATKATKVGSTAGATNKTDLVLKKLRLARGVTIAQITEVTGWQPHSVRGFLSAVVRKKLGLTLASETGKDGQRRYRLIDSDVGQAG